MEKVFENSKGNKLFGILSNPTGSKDKPVIVLCHGFGSSKESRTHVSLEKILNTAGISTFRFDFYGHGESQGDFEDITISEAVDDILNAIELLKNLGYSRIGLVGSSFGGMASILAASKTKDIFVLALKAPVSDYLGRIISDMARYPIDKWKKQGYIQYEDNTRLNYSFFEDAQDVDGYGAAAKIKVPTLIVHGDKDDAVPVEQSIKTAELIKNCRLEIIPGADHLFSELEDFEKMLKLISGFIVEIEENKRNA